MTPMFFGASESPLFGVLHEPEGDARGHGVLLCPPIGQEHVRAHWAFRQIAQALSRAGFHCLRFDWFGAGDSAGDLASASIERWLDDAKAAARELRDAASVRKISVVGLRMGATLAALAAPRIKPVCAVLWDPVVSGERHIAELGRLEEELLSTAGRFWLAKKRAPRPSELVGFDYGHALIEEIGHLDIGRIAAMPRTRVCLLDSSSSPERAALGEALRARGLTVEEHETGVRGRWLDPDEIEEMLLPADALRTIVDYLERESA